MRYGAWEGCSNCYAEIVLTADPGWNMRLNSFDMAGWPNSDQSGQSVHVIPSSGVPSLQDNITIKGNGGTHNSFTPNMTAQSIVIDFAYNDNNVGIDNINFDQINVSVVTAPEPSTFVLAGVVLLAIGRRFRIHAPVSLQRHP